MDNSTLLKIVILVGLAVCLIYLCQQNAKPSRESFEDEKAEELPETFETDDEDEDEDYYTYLRSYSRLLMISERRSHSLTKRFKCSRPSLISLSKRLRTSICSFSY